MGPDFTAGVSVWPLELQGEVAVTRIMKGEMHRRSKNAVSHCSLTLELKSPAVLLHGAIQLYQGKRHLCAENMVSAPLVATKGILAGCPLAPGLSKIVLALFPALCGLLSP